MIQSNKKKLNLEWSICVCMIVCIVLRVNRVHVYCHAYNYMVPHSPLCYWKWTCLGSITTTMSIHIKLEAHDIPQGLNIILWEINLGVLYEALCQSIYLHGPYQAASLKWSPLIYSLCFLRNAHSSAQDFLLLHL